MERYINLNFIFILSTTVFLHQDGKTIKSAIENNVPEQGNSSLAAKYVPGRLSTICYNRSRAILFLFVYFIIILSDLECDYLNAQQCCSRLNQWVFPKIIAHIFSCFLLLIHGHWILMLLNLPMAAWMAYEIISVPSGNLGIYEPTEIHNRGQLKKYMRDCMIYLGYYLIFFCIYLYCMIASLLKEDTHRNDEFVIIDNNKDI